MKEFTWTLKDGRTAILKAEYSERLVKKEFNLDGDTFITDKYDLNTNGEIKVYVEGKLVGGTWLDEGNHYHWYNHDGIWIINGMPDVGFSEENMTKVKAFLNSVVEEEKSKDKEVIEFKKAEEAKKIEEDIDFYSKVVARGEAQTKMMTTAERDAWEKEFNETYNEGGEGFVPHYISVEELSEMKNRLKELKNKLEHLRIG